MENKDINLMYNGRRILNSSRILKRYIMGSVFLIIGLIGLFISDPDLILFYLVLIIGGALNVAQAVWGKELIKEKNSISISGDEIEYKNSFKKPKRIKINDLMDLRIETSKVEFVHTDQRVETYEFSVFQRQELDRIYHVLETIKSTLTKKPL